MKYRNGFVSNSSSSSFVIMGYDVPANEATEQEKSDGIYMQGDGTYLVGKMLCDMDEFLVEEYSLLELNNIAFEISEKYNKEIADIFLIMGKYYS